MFNFEDELVLESFRVPWLIWIQLLVFLLFIVFLFCFTIIASDHTIHDSPSTLHSTHVFTNPLQVTRGVENMSIKGEIPTSTEIVRVREGISEEEASSLYFLHPCYYFKLARVAFLKCFGLDSISESENPSTQRHREKKKES
ncbi:hypothetical protein QL285_072031 [Trifolium repens]|nr:hypothetical protein QL285_072031 [Trifolium repens]